MKPRYSCELLIVEDGRAKVIMLQDHQGRGGRTGETTITSPVVKVDFVARTLETQNSIYHFVLPSKE